MSEIKAYFTFYHLRRYWVYFTAKKFLFQKQTEKDEVNKPVQNLFYLEIGLGDISQRKHDGSMEFSGGKDIPLFIAVKDGMAFPDGHRSSGNNDIGSTLRS